MSIASEEIQQQLDRIVALGYPDVADMSADAFRKLACPLLKALENSDLGEDILLAVSYTHLTLPTTERV